MGPMRSFHVCAIQEGDGMRRARVICTALLIGMALGTVAGGRFAVYGAKEPPEAYRPEFTLDAEKGIFDHGRQIARFDSTQMKNCQPSLRYVVLKPGKQPNIDEIQCYWLQGTTLKNLKVSAEGQNTDRLAVRFRSEEEQGVYIDERDVVVTYDGEIDSYVYTSEARFIVQKGKSYRTHALQFTDPHWIHVGLPGPSLPTGFINEMAGGASVWPIFRPATGWKPLFQFFVYEAADGNVYKVHLDHLVPATHESLPLKKDAIYAAVYNPEYGNPAFQFLGDTGPRTTTGICHWGYDIHMSVRPGKPGEYVTLKGGDTVVARFRVFQLPDEKALDLMRRARPKPLPPEEVLRYLAPVFRLHSTFFETMDPYKTGGDVDPMGWSAFGEVGGPCTFLATSGPVWSTTMGRTDGYCVGCIHPEPAHSGWCATTGTSHWTGTQPARDKVWKMTAFIKTKDVEGKGAFVSLQQANWGEKRESKPLTGTNDWTEVSVLAQPGSGGMGNFYVKLELDGKGSAWFDDVSMAVVDHPWPSESH